MKKKILTFIFAICLIFPCAVMFTGCGEQFIEERNYNLLGMTVVEDNTPYIYRPFEDGTYTTSFCGSMSIQQCKLNVGRKSSILIYDDVADSGIKAEYVFDVYTSSDVYPAYTFKSYSITLNGENAKNLTEEQIALLDADVQTLYKEVKQFSTMCSYGDTSVQLVTQNKSLACHIVVTEHDSGNLLFMSVLYGY